MAPATAVPEFVATSTGRSKTDQLRIVHGVSTSTKASAATRRRAQPRGAPQQRYQQQRKQQQRLAAREGRQAADRAERDRAADAGLLVQPVGAQQRSRATSSP